MENKEQEKQPEFVAFPITLINELLEYLSGKPFKEVNPLIVSLQKEGKILSTIQSDNQTEQSMITEEKAVEDATREG